MPAALTVVIASHNAAGPIASCLSALVPQRAQCDEVIVADSSTDETPAIVAGRFPWVRLLHFDEPLTVPELRGRAIAASEGAIIAVLDPYSVPAIDWARRVIESHHRHPHLVIGGAVDLHDATRQPLGAWTLYFNEYGLFMSPVAEGETWIVPGSNVSYKRAALFEGGAPKYPVFWKTFANWDAESAGSRPWLDPAIHVALNKPIPLRDYLMTRYYHGRCFGAMRVARAGVLARAVRAGTSPLVPLVLLWRWTRGILAKGRYRARFVVTMPAQLVLFCWWAWGELCGYVAGPGGACRRLYY